MSNASPEREVSAPARPRLTDTDRGQTIFVMLWVLGTLATIGIWVGAFLAGQYVAGGAVEPEETAAPVEEVASLVSLGGPPLAVGQWEWFELQGGECIARFEGAFAEVFSVVTCQAPHAAQLAVAELISADILEAYPGDDVVLARARELCDLKDEVNAAVAAEFSDLRIAYSYPVDSDQWDKGQRGVYCFIYSESGQPLTAPLFQR